MRNAPNCPTMDAGWIAAAAVVAIDVGLIFLYNIISERKIDRKLKNVWNERVELEDMDGSIIKIPVRYQKDDGSVETKHEVGPLWMSVAYGLGSFAGSQIKMAIMGEKGRMSQKIGAGLLAQAQKGDVPLEAVLEFLPKKAQKALAVVQAIKAMTGAAGQGGNELTIQQSNRRGGGPI